MLRVKWLVLPIVLNASVALAASSQRDDLILMEGRIAGKQMVETAPEGMRAEYSYRDRGHGVHIAARWKLDAAGAPVEYRGSGNDYQMNPVEERFELKDGKASWKNNAESGEKTVNGEAFYVPLNAPPEFLGVLARALLKAPDRRLTLLPAGMARIEAVEEVKVATASGETALVHYLVSGLDFAPISIWLDRGGTSAATVSSWFSVMAPAYRNAMPQLQTAQDAIDNAWMAHLASEQTHVPKHSLVIRNARLFDPRDLSVTPGTSVLIERDRIVRISPDADLKVPDGVETIDAHGRFLMPGLWDNHAHLGDNDGALDLIAGITSVRDMANDTDGFLKRVTRFDDGSELGPRVLKAGIIDGTGPGALAFRQADTADDAIKAVDWYADHGYAQIKIYSSMKPELVPLIADRAHARGLRVSGHVPGFMSARQFIEAGADEIQHMYFIELNFLYPRVDDTRNTMVRLAAATAHAQEFTPDKPQVREFIDFLKRHHTVLDPTMSILESQMSGDVTVLVPGMENVLSRYPAQARRALQSLAIPVPDGQAAAYHSAFPATLKLLKALYDAGVTIVPGTDNTPVGYGLHHELQLYARSGIPAPEVLRMATLTSAQVMGVDKDLGAIAAGKLADMVLIDGDPTQAIADIQNVTTVIKAGKVYDPAAIETALGIAPRR